MKIKMFVKEGGFLAFECQGVIKEPLEKISYDQDTHVFSLVFKDSGEWVKLDCPVDEEALGAIGPYEYCVLGFCDGKKILGAAMVPLEGIPRQQVK